MVSKGGQYHSCCFQTKNLFMENIFLLIQYAVFVVVCVSVLSRVMYAHVFELS